MRGREGRGWGKVRGKEDRMGGREEKGEERREDVKGNINMGQTATVRGEKRKCVRTYVWEEAQRNKKHNVMSIRTHMEMAKGAVCGCVSLTNCTHLISPPGRPVSAPYPAAC